MNSDWHEESAAKSDLFTVEKAEPGLVQISGKWFFCVRIDDRVMVLDTAQAEGFILRANASYEVLVRERAKEVN